jgi:microcin C transport system ATP-binding protein
LLEITDLRVAFGETRRSCTASSLKIAAGEKLALVGESGSGKSVTALSLLRLVQMPS